MNKKMITGLALATLVMGAGVSDVQAQRGDRDRSDRNDRYERHRGHDRYDRSDRYRRSSSSRYNVYYRSSPTYRYYSPAPYYGYGYSYGYPAYNSYYPGYYSGYNSSSLGLSFNF